MDERHWVRMAICLAPGIVLTRWAHMTEQGEWASTICSGILMAGLLMYAAWIPLRRKLNLEERKPPETKEVPQRAKDGMNQLEMLHELIRLSGDDEAKAIWNIEMEYHISQEDNLINAVEKAYLRACLKEQMVSGNGQQRPIPPSSSKKAEMPENQRSSIQEETEYRKKGQLPA